MNKKKLEQLRRELSAMPEGALHVKHSSKYTSFVEYTAESGAKNINKEQDKIYALARKKYIKNEIAIMEETSDGKLIKLNAQRNKMLTNFEKSGLDLARITMTPSQYKWMHDTFPSNQTHKEDLIHITSSGIAMRSKSECKIGNMYEKLGIPYRYEMALTMDVFDLVEYLVEVTKDYRHGKRLYSYSGNLCFWNVPPELSWMNQRGSIWRRFDASKGTITIFPDFNPLTFDGQRLVHEHEGMTSDPYYRSNASERIFVMRHSGAVTSDNLFFTFEQDLLDSRYLESFLRDNILTRI